MSIAEYNWTWQQGSDLVMGLIYREGPEDEQVPVDLTGYSLRMDIAYNGTRVYTFNSDVIADVDPITVGAQPDNTTEAVLDADGNINITIDRSLTLPSGGVYTLMTPGSDIVLGYDIFLRNTTNRQSKILKGNITVEWSYTLWV